MSSPAENYRIYAVKYAHFERRSGDNFIGGDSHDVPMPLDYFVWAIHREGEPPVIVDTGFGEQAAAARGRIITRPLVEGLRSAGIDAQAFDHWPGDDPAPRSRRLLAEAGVDDHRWVTFAMDCPDEIVERHRQVVVVDRRGEVGRRGALVPRITDRIDAGDGGRHGLGF